MRCVCVRVCVCAQNGLIESNVCVWMCVCARRQSQESHARLKCVRVLTTPTLASPSVGRHRSVCIHAGEIRKRIHVSCCSPPFRFASETARRVCDRSTRTSERTRAFACARKENNLTSSITHPCVLDFRLRGKLHEASKHRQTRMKKKSGRRAQSIPAPKSSITKPSLTMRRRRRRRRGRR